MENTFLKGECLLLTHDQMVGSNDHLIAVLSSLQKGFQEIRSIFYFQMISSAHAAKS